MASRFSARYWACPIVCILIQQCRRDVCRPRRVFLWIDIGVDLSSDYSKSPFIWGALSDVPCSCYFVRMLRSFEAQAIAARRYIQIKLEVVNGT